MVETAAILNQADDRALVFLDEIGRGTATYDGLSIAWARWNICMTFQPFASALFATHLHEMTALSNKLDGVDYATVAVKEVDGEVYLPAPKVKKGAARHSVLMGRAGVCAGCRIACLRHLPGARFRA